MSEDNQPFSVAIHASGIDLDLKVAEIPPAEVLMRILPSVLVKISTTRLEEAHELIAREIASRPVES